MDAQNDLLALPEHERRKLVLQDVKYPYGNTGTKKRKNNQVSLTKQDANKQRETQLCLPLP